MKITVSVKDKAVTLDSDKVADQTKDGLKKGANATLHGVHRLLKGLGEGLNKAASKVDADPEYLRKKEAEEKAEEERIAKIAEAKKALKEAKA